MNIRNVFKSIIIALSIVEVILVIVMVMTNKEEVKVVTNRPVAVEIVVGKPHGVVDILNEKNILTPIEDCDNNPRACRWARGERKELSVLRYTQTRDNLTSNRGAIVATIDEVRNQLTLVPNDDRVSNLVYRTFVHESLLGSINFTNSNGQGIGQLTLKHAKDVLKRISKRSPENFAIIAEISEIKNLLELSDKEMLKELHTNLKLQVALCILTYWFKDPKFYLNAGSLEQDAKMWKQLYNTELGKGTVEASVMEVVLFIFFVPSIKT